MYVGVLHEKIGSCFQNSWSRTSLTPLVVVNGKPRGRKERKLEV